MRGWRGSGREGKERTCGETTDDARSAYARVDDGDNVAELGLEGGVEVGAALDGRQAVAVRQLGEDPDLAAVLKLNAWGVSRDQRAAIEGESERSYG